MSAEKAEQVRRPPGPLWLEADLIAIPVARLLAQRPEARVIQIFRRSMNLITSEGVLFSLTLSGLDAGPFSMRLRSDAHPELSLVDALGQGIEDLEVSVGEADLTVGRLNVDMQSAKSWNPRLASRRLHQVNSEIAIGHLFEFLRYHAPEDSLFRELTSDGDSWIVARLRQAWDQIRQAIARAEPERCREGARLAAGAGIGLTPAGDDFLMGVLLAFWLGMEDPTSFSSSLLAGASGRTGRLSMALLQAAGRGEAGRAWHAMATAIAGRDARTIREMATILMAAGHTSGADALLGFTLALETITLRP